MSFSSRKFFQAIAMAAVIGAAIAGSPLGAKPLIRSSEQSVVTLCEQRTGEPAEVIQACTAALGESELSNALRAELTVSLADALYWENRNEEAASLMHDLLQQEPKHARAHAFLGWIAHDERNYADAVNWFSASLEHEVSANALAGMGSAGYYAETMPLDEALTYLDAAIAISPEYSWAMREKGWMLRSETRWEQALAPFQAALEQDRRDVNANLGMAQTLYELANYALAFEHITIVLEEQPQNATNVLWRSHILRALGRNRQAISDARKALELDPGFDETHVALARALFEAGKRVEALDVLREGHAKLPQSSFVAYWLADLLNQDHQIDEAWRVVGTLTEMPNPSGYDYKLKATIALERDALPEAREAIDLSVEQAPWLAHAYLVDALIMLEEDRVEDAIGRFKQGVERDLHPASFGDMIGALVAKGRFVEAIQLRLYLKE